MYADDCILFCSGNNWNIMSQKIQPDLDNIQSWCERNRLKISDTKSKVLLLGSIAKLRTVDYTHFLYLGHTCLDFVDRYKYLGITLDKHMNLTNLSTDVKKESPGSIVQTD